ncbi:Aste57867_19831 [Aphanomyces stellatus]|uniref:Aste57867_19831 protein n=1 Tax=Aphanomyces stellatus TaxID=120398 RepID=A0A485LDN1_9STRA|nr:hypothetical protein As57867_019766 [Aphanomyces stellatus]VFT96529.1 Aste57867_19831 [Aphanomyces stellatus]
MLHHIFRTKPMEVIEAEELKEELPRELGLWDLIAIGVGGTVGSGVFATTGDIISGAAGPAAFLSWVVAGLACVLSGFAYMEMSSLIPSSGSTYAYSYHVLGELPAAIAAWLLTLEYGMSGAGVARSWAQKVQEWAEENGGSYGWLNDPSVNFLGCLVMVVSTVVLLGGLRFGKVFINVVTVTKVAVVLFIIVAGFYASSSDNLKPFIPARDDDKFGVQGIFLGASQAFFGFVGFDEVCCMAAEARNPRKIMPRAVIGTILGTMFLSSFASLALAGMLPYNIATLTNSTVSYSFTGGFDHVGYSTAKLIVHIGECGTMPIVVFIAFLAQPRLLYAMSVDGLLPKVFGKVDANGNLFWSTLISGTFLALVALLVPFSTLWNMVSFGILVSFIMTNCCLILVRTRDASPRLSYSLTGAIVALACAAMFLFQKAYVVGGSDAGLVVGMVFLAATLATAAVLFAKCPQNSGEANMFRAPLVPFVPTLAILVNWYLIAQLDEKDIARGCIWIAAAIVSYFLYGFRFSAGRDGWAATLAHVMPGLNEVRPSMSYMMSGHDHGSTLKAPLLPTAVPATEMTDDSIKQAS